MQIILSSWKLPPLNKQNTPWSNYYCHWHAEERRGRRRGREEVKTNHNRSEQHWNMRQWRLQTQVSHWQETSLCCDLVWTLSQAATQEHIHAHLFLKAERPQGIRVNIKSVCVCLCVWAGVCGVSVTQQESSSHLCLSAAPASLTNEARNDSSALHSACLSLPHNTVQLFIITIISRPPKTLTSSTILSVLAQKQHCTHYHHLLCQHHACLPLSLNPK